MAHHFFAYMNRMKYIRRWGLMRNTQVENDMEHSLQTAMIAHAIALLGNARFGRAYDAEHIMALAVYHDASEVITGDLPTPIKHNNPVIKDEYHRLERIANELMKAQKNLQGLEAKLSNENFTSRAPEAVVNDIRDKAEKARALIAQLEESEAAMKKL